MLDLEPEELSYTRQKTILENSLQTYGTENVLGVAVGNEYVLVSIQEGDTTENSTSRVVEKMNEVRTDLQTLGYDLPVGTSDAGEVMLGETKPVTDDMVRRNRDTSYGRCGGLVSWIYYSRYQHLTHVALLSVFANIHVRTFQ